MGELIPIVIVPAFFYATYAIFELFVRRKERMAIIEKLAEGINTDMLKHKIGIVKMKNENSWALRIGCLLLGIGLGVLLVSIVDLTLEFERRWDSALNAMYPAAAALFGGLGLIIAYILEKKYEKKEDK